MISRKALALSLVLLAAIAPAQSFVNFENAHVHPLDMSPDGTHLLAVNTPDNRLEVFDLTTPTPTWLRSVRVGLEPVSVRALDNQVAWVVNHLSDTVTLVDYQAGTATQTLFTRDEPADVVFAGGGASGPTKAYVSCSQANLVMVFNLSNLALPPAEIAIVGEEPRMMAVSPARDRVYVAVFQSGNNTTILPGGSFLGAPPDIVNDPGTPYGGVNPPPNGPGGNFRPAFNPLLPQPPKVGLIVRKDPSGVWRDDTGTDWTPWVSGAQAPSFDRLQGWDLADNDLGIIDVATDTVTYAKGAMNFCMAIAVRDSGSGHDVSIVGTDSTNEIRFEPNINGTFVRVLGSRVDPATTAIIGTVDLNPHLSYAMSTIPQAQRDESLADPRGVVWATGGNVGWVSGKGSNNVVRIDAFGGRTGRVEVGEGPTGLVLDEVRGRLYVQNHFGGSVSVVDTAALTTTATVPYHDPTPLAIRAGRKHLYDTHKNSGLGQVACASCHVDARMDNQAWDLGNPAGDLKTITGTNVNNVESKFLPPGALNWHPMKGPMTTQTLQDIIGKEPLHWRGDRASLQEFNGAFTGLQGDDQQLSAKEMEQYVDFLATLHFPPNPFRGLDDALLTNVDLGTLEYRPLGGPAVPLGSGDAQNGLALYLPPNNQDGFSCSTCHSLPVGIGPDMAWDGTMYNPVPVGGFGEHHSALNTSDPNFQLGFKVPQLRNMHEKTGYDTHQLVNTSGFGYIHDGSVDTVAHFISEPVFTHTPGNEAQDVADLTAFMFSFNSPTLPQGIPQAFQLPPGQPSNDVHPGVGFQYTISAVPQPGSPEASVLLTMFQISDASPHVTLVAHQNEVGGGQRGYAYVGAFNFQTDQAAVTTSVINLLLTAAPGRELTFTAVATGTETRIGVDRDDDGVFDGDERNAGSDPDDPLSVTPLGVACSQLAPTPPTGVSGTAASAHLVNVSWSDTAANEDGFLVERALQNSPQWEEVGVVGANVTSLGDDGVAAAASYLYRVTAFNCGGRSAAATSGAAVTTPPTPGTITAHAHEVALQLFDLSTTGTTPVLRTLSYGVIEVKDQEGRNVKGATVIASWTAGPGLSGLTAVTNEHGQAFFASGVSFATSETWTLTLNGITGPSITYDPTANFESSKTIVFP